jgi:hypothetical protein
MSASRPRRWRCSDHPCAYARFELCSDKTWGPAENENPPTEVDYFCFKICEGQRTVQHWNMSCCSMSDQVHRNQTHFILFFLFLFFFLIFFFFFLCVLCPFAQSWIRTQNIFLFNSHPRWTKMKQLTFWFFFVNV